MHYFENKIPVIDYPIISLANELDTEVRHQTKIGWNYDVSIFIQLQASVIPNHMWSAINIQYQKNIRAYGYWFLNK